MNIVEFLEARIDEDEKLARDAIEDDMGQDGGFEDAYDRLTGKHAVSFAPSFGEAAARMIIWNTPRRVLAECRAKRAILDMAADIKRRVERTPGHNHPLLEASVAMRVSLVALASVYADHPDYDPEWRHA